jgi:hypothetical protein
MKFDHYFVSSCLYLLFQKKYSLKFHYINIYLSWALAFFLLEHLFCLSHNKTHWTMSVDQCPRSLWAYSVKIRVILITYFTRPWEDFMVLYVNTPPPQVIGMEPRWQTCHGGGHDRDHGWEVMGMDMYACRCTWA